MRALFAKIREILRDRHLRRIWTRVISVMASVVVFISTYALILPAITMESEAACGIEAHQHTDECYEDVLTCGQEESEDHQHTDACYTRTLICGKEAHIHSAECYKEDSSAVAVSGGTAVPAVTDGSAGDSSSDQSSGNHQTGQTSQPTQVDVSDASGPAADADGQGAGAEMSGTPENAGTTVTAEGLPADANTLSDGTGYVPVLDILNFDSLLTRETGFYYFHAEEEQAVPENSSAITDWKKLKNNMTLASTDLVKVYLAYSIPAGALNETNQTARYRLPANLHLTDDQIQAINRTENGVAAAFAAAENGSGNDSGNGNSESAADGSENTDSGITGAGETDASANYEKYLGAEAVEGTRTPDKTLRDGAQEYISATVRAENVYEGMLDENGNYIDFAGTQASPASDRKDLGDYIGQDLIFTFTPYTVQKNQNTYDTEGNPLTAGEKVTGWFAVDFNMDQIDWVEEDTDLDKSTVEKSAEVIFALEDASVGSKEKKTTLRLEEQAPAGENGTEDTADQDKAADENADLNKTDKDATDSKDAEENAEKAVDAEDAEKAADHTDGTLTADGDGYSITLAYTADAQIPENASLSVKEITPDTDPEAYEACLQQAAQKMGASIPESGNAGTNADANTGAAGDAADAAKAGAPALDTAASRFFDIEIVVTNEDGKTEKIEPKAPVAVNIQLSSAPEAAKQDKAANAASRSAESGKSGEEISVDSVQKADPTVLHFAEEGVEEMDATVAAPADGNTANGKKDETGSGDTKQAENAAGTMEISFEAESFSIYGVVYTVDFEYTVNGKVYQFSLKGGDKINLSELVNVLGMLDDADYEDTDAFLADVENVEFSDESLVKITHRTPVLGIFGSEDWVLESLQAFDTEESLTITMKNGDVVTVRVTDASHPGYTDLQSSATEGLSFSVVEQESGTATYDPNSKSYNMQLKVDFQIPSNNITGENAQKKYDLKFADGLKIPDAFLNRDMSAYDSVTGDESFKYRLVKDSDYEYHMLIEYTDDYISSIKESGRTIGNNSLTIDISVGSEQLQDDGSVKVPVVQGTEITVTPDKITYPEGTDGRHDISVSKQFGGYDKTTNKMKYTMIVSSSLGTAEPITVEDGLTVLGGSDITVSDLTVTSVKTGEGSEYYLDNVDQNVTNYTATPSADHTHFTLTLPQAGMPSSNKTVYLVEYEYTLSGVGDDFESNGKNSVTASSGSISKEGEAAWNISQTGVALNKTGQYNAETGKITWTINVTNNKDSAIPLQDDALKGLNYSDLSISPADSLTFDSTSGTLTIPAGKGYTITYDTAPAIADPTKDTAVTNKVTADNKTAEPVVTVPKEATASKELVSVARGESTAVLNWRVKIHVPKTGFAAGTTFTEKLSFTQDYQNYNNLAFFTETQKTALVNAFKAYFGDAIVQESYTPSGKVPTDEYGNYRIDQAELVMKLNANWSDTNYNGKDIFIEYQTTADLSDLHSDNNGYDNTFLLNDISVTATHSFKERVVKMASPNNAANETTANADQDNKKLHWYIQVALEQDARSINVTDTLPAGLKLTAIRMGDSPYNLIGLVEASDGNWEGETFTDWRNGVPAWNSTYLSDSTATATVDGQKVNISLIAEQVPDYLKANDVFYFYIEAEIDDSEFPTTGTTEKTYKNTVNVSVEGAPYASDDQTQNVTLKTSIVNKTGDTSVWNAQNGAHELSYIVDINPNGGQIAGPDGVITLTDHIEYYKTVKDNQGNSHNVSLNLKEGSAKLQRKDSNGQWIDIPATEGWGYILNEDAASPSDNIKAKEINVFGIPDNTPLRFVYTYNVVVENLAKNATVRLGAIKNTATLHANTEESSSHTETKDWKNIQSSGTTESTGSLTIVKVQDGNYAIALPDTHFVLEQFVPTASNIDSQGTWQAINAVGSTIDGTGDYSSLKVYRTNSNGKLIISSDPHDLGKVGGFQYDTLYRVREYEAHEGYTLEGVNPGAVYFYFGQNVTQQNKETALAGYHFDSASTHADDLLIEADTVYMTNKRIVDTITARKLWNATTLWPEDVNSITLELRKDGQLAPMPSSYSVEHDGKYYTADDTSFSNPWTNPQSLTAANPQATWEKLDIDTTAANAYAGYSIVETGIKYKGSALTPETVNANMYHWKTASDGEVVFETFGGTVTNGMGTIVNVSKTKLDVEKSWGTQELGAGSNIQVIMTLVKEERLYAQHGGMESTFANWKGNFEPVADMAPITLDGTTDEIEKEQWKAAFENLDRFRYDESTDRLYEIRYSVKETVKENGRDVTDRYLATLNYDNNGEKVTVTNAPNVGKLAVVKQWQRRTPEEGETLPDLPGTIYISLERYYYDGNGVRQNDNEFNADHRGIAITAEDTWEKDSNTTYTWSKLFENLQRQAEVNGKRYDYKYLVKEDNVPGFTKVIVGDNITLHDGTTGQVDQVTVTNVENESQYVPELIDIHLEKDFTDEEGEPQMLPDGATATFRLYRYITSETGTYNMITKELTLDETSRRMEDETFNSTDNDAEWTHVLSVEEGTPTGTRDGYTFFMDEWTNLPISEIYYDNGSYVKNTYEYYLVETAATDNAHHAYTALYMKDGSKDRPITIESDGTEVENGNDIKEAEVWNVESDTTFTIRKYWYGLDKEFMPPVVVTFKHNENNQWSDVNSFGTSSNGAVTYGNTKFKKADGTEFYGYKLDNSNDWNISFAGLPTGQYDVIEVGYLTKNANNEDVVVEFNSTYFETNNRYNYTTDQKKVYDISGFTYDTVRNTFNNNNHTSNNNNYGTLGICNAPKQTGGQLYLQKKWYSFTGHGGFADVTAGYDGKGDGDKETYIVMQVYQRPYWAFENAGDKEGMYVTPWEEFGDPIKYSVSEVIAHGFAWNGGGGQWHIQVESNVNMPKYGYLPDPDDGIAKLVMFDYKWVEVGQIPGSDGRTYRTYYTGYPNEPENHKDDPTYYDTQNGKQIIENYETGLLLLIKEWKANNLADKVFFTVVDDRGIDIAKKVYEASDKSFYGVKDQDVAYIPELGKYVFVLNSSDAVSDNRNRWELMIRGLDIVKDVDEETHQGYGEVTYTVEEVGAEVTEEIDGNDVKAIYSVNDSNYPYTASYYNRVRFNQEQYVGNTVAGTEDGSPMVAGGMQLDSGRAYAEDGSLTWVRTVNSDEPTTELTVHKKWPDDKYPGESVKVVLNLEQRRQKTDENNQPLWQDEDHTIPQWEGDWHPAEGTTRVSVTLPLAGYSGENAWTYTWKGLPIYKSTGSIGAQDEVEPHDILWYRVVESSAPGWTSSRLTTIGGDNITETGATGDKTHPITEVLTNDIDNTNIHIKKQWTNLYANSADQSEDWMADKPVIKWPEGYAIDYKVVRHAWIVSATETDASTEGFPEDSTRPADAPTSFEQKHVTYTDGFEVEDWKKDPFLTGSLSASNPNFDLTGQPKGIIYTTDDDPPAGLSKNTTYLVEYVYEVVETAITTPYGTQTVNLPVIPNEKNDDGQYVKEGGVVLGDVTITNDLTNIEVEKNWTLNGESYMPGGDESVTVQLYRSKERPEGTIPVTPGKINIYVDPMDNQGRKDMANGSIVVTVTGDNGYSKDYTLNGPNYLVQTDELPDIAEATGSDITYTVTVKSVDGTVIETATVNGDGSTTTGGNVTLTAKAVTPPASFTLNFSSQWFVEGTNTNEASNAVDPPKNSNAWIKFRLSYAGQNEEITLNQSNNWGATLNKTLLVYDDNNEQISYRIQAVGGDNTYVLRADNFQDYTFTGTDKETISVPYKGLMKPPLPEDGEVKFNNKIYSVGVGGQFTLNVMLYDWAVNQSNVATFELRTNEWDQNTRIGEVQRADKLKNSLTFTMPASGGAYLVLTSNNSYIIQSSSLKAATTSSSRRVMKAAKAPALRGASPKSVTVLGQNDLTPIDAVSVGDPVTLSGNTWSKLWENLPTTDENGDAIYYYVKELTANIPGDTEYVGTTYTYDKHNPDDAREGYSKVTVTNNLEREEPEYGSVKVTKAFVGLPSSTLPNDFIITNTVNDTIFTVANKSGGSGTIYDPYYWTIDNLKLGTEVSFTESGYDMKGYNVVVTGSANAATATATAATTPGVASFVNTYTPKVTDFEFYKIWLPMTANLNSFTASDQRTWPTGAEITVEITRNNDDNFKLTYKLNGTSTEFEPESIAGTTLTKEQLKLVKTGDKDYNFKLVSDVLEAVYVEGAEEKPYVYTVKETDSPIDYAAKHYGRKESDAWKYKQDMVNGAGNGEVIINQETGGYELPSTGGPGTRLFTILGSILILGAGVLLWRRRRTI